MKVTKQVLKYAEKLKHLVTWNVFLYDFNQKTIKSYNVFQHALFLNETVKAFLETDSQEAFNEELRKVVHYYFWAKCEYEVLISGWPPTENKEEETKVDVCTQLELNWNLFVDIVYKALSSFIKKKET